MHKNDYADMRNRLIEYRKRLALSTSELAQLTGITETRYVKYEKGLMYMPCSVLDKLYQAGWDIDYIVNGSGDIRTGTMKAHLGDLDFLQPEEIRCLIVWTFLNLLSNLDSGIQQEIQLLKILSDYEICQNRPTPSAVELIRKMMDHSQGQMAEELGVCVKVYRGAEKDIFHAKAWVLQEFCSISGFRASVMFSRDLQWHLIELVWAALSQMEQERVLSFVKKGIAFMRQPKVSA